MRAKPVRYSLKVARRFCGLIAGGRSRVSVHRQAGMPSVASVSRWLAAHPEFRRMYDAACAHRALAAAKAGLPDPSAQGRPSGYTPALAGAICGLVAEGLPLRAIGRRPDMPCLATLVNWKHEHPEFLQMYLRAFEQFAELVADETVEIADRALGEDWPSGEGRGAVSARDAIALAKLRIETRNGRIGRMQPKTWERRPAAAGVAPEPPPAGLSYEERLRLLR